tara:strand:+ start:593 stop:1555 length:963 start_codon:yes stop_codon:yes gene_type:complete
MRFKKKKISGDASFRTFYRLKLSDKNKIIVYAKKEKYKNLIAYAAINQFLRSNKILAPKLYEHNYPKNMIIIEDFGDLTFNKVLARSRKKILIYKELVNLLIKIQKIKTKTKIKSIVSKPHIINKYSIKYLFKESDLFFDWYLPLFLSKKKSLYIKLKSRKILLKIYKKLNFSNSCFVHRDYHVHNLMRYEKKVGVIDTQDALIGNPAYDLASLIDDVRIKTSPKLKKQIYNYYLKNSKLYKFKPQEFLEDFNILSVQRNLKIVGIFSRLFKRDKKKKYLKLIPYAWKLLEMRMNSKVFLNLKKVLDINIPKEIRRTVNR